MSQFEIMQKIGPRLKSNNEAEKNISLSLLARAVLAN